MSREKPTVRFILEDGTMKEVEANVGDSLLDVARHHCIDLEGACGGALACSTCHLIIDAEWYKALSEPSDDEEDMLDLAFGLTPTSRLGCQIRMTPELDGITVTLPPVTRHLASILKKRQESP